MLPSLILINGCPGVGKTETAIGLARNLSGRNLVLDLDRIAHIEPFACDQDFYNLSAANLFSCLSNARRIELKWIIISGVLVSTGLRDSVLSIVEQFKFESVYRFSLLASNEELLRRIKSDPKGQDTEARILDMRLDAQIRSDNQFRIVETSALSLNQVIQSLLHLIDNVNTESLCNNRY